MRDTMYLFRKAIYDVLNGNLSFNGQPVNVYDEKKKVGTSDNIFVILSTQQESDEDANDCTFITLSSIDIEVLHKSEYEVSKDAIDDISNQILEVIIPSPSLNGLGVQNNYLIQCVRRARAISRNFSISDTESIIAKIITIEAKIVQQN